MGFLFRLALIFLILLFIFRILQRFLIALIGPGRSNDRFKYNTKRKEEGRITLTNSDIKKSKKIGKNEGEYVRYEEVKDNNE
ncbi:DUF4834 domain-containing protein [Bacteroidota bacterium]